MSKWDECDRPECKREWDELTKGGTQEDQDAEYDDGGYGVQHCQYPGCHEIYMRGKNGVDCERCGRRVCEGCQCNENRMVCDEELDEYVCKGGCLDHI